MKKKSLEEEAAKIGTYFVRMCSNFALKWGEREGEGGLKTEKEDIAMLLNILPPLQSLRYI
jgi:hypothetical protein